jgi:hypothetical protein
VDTKSEREFLSGVVAALVRIAGALEDRAHTEQRVLEFLRQRDDGADRLTALRIERERLDLELTEYRAEAERIDRELIDREGTTLKAIRRLLLERQAEMK